MAEILHDSDCATHNMPAYPNGPCDCGAALAQEVVKSSRDLCDAAFEAAARIVEPTDEPCDCISNVDGHWTYNCQCMNSGDIRSAATWCSGKGDAERIRALKSTAA